MKHLRYIGQVWANERVNEKVVVGSEMDSSSSFDEPHEACSDTTIDEVPNFILES